MVSKASDPLLEAPHPCLRSTAAGGELDPGIRWALFGFGDFPWIWASLGSSQSAGRLVNQSPEASDSSPAMFAKLLEIAMGAVALVLGALLNISAD